MTNTLWEKTFSNFVEIGVYPLVNLQKTMERSTMLLMEKSTISMVIFFKSYVCLPEGIPNAKYHLVNKQFANLNMAQSK